MWEAALLRRPPHAQKDEQAAQGPVAQGRVRNAGVPLEA